MEFIEKNAIEDEDILLLGILRNPIFFTEFVLFLDQYIDTDGNVDLNNVFRHFKYQENILADFNRYVSVRASRSAGKTVTLRSKILWLLTMAPYGKDPILFTAPNQYHLDPVWDAVVSLFRTNTFLKSFLISEHRGINVQKHTITTRHGNSWIGRIAGEGRGGKNIIGLHVAAILLDEAGYYPWDTFQELQPVLNKDKLTPGAQIVVAGTPSGGRDKNVLYYADTSKEYSHHRMNAFMNPFYTEEDHRNDIEQYGGKDSPEYIHFVLGEHGSPAYSLFDRNSMLILTYPVYKLRIDNRNGKLSEMEILGKANFLPSVGKEFDEVVFGVDLGYTDPTAFYILKKKEEKFYIHAKISLLKVPYPIQRKFILRLIDDFKPEWVAVDIGSSGLQFYQELIKDEKLSINKDKIIPVNFSSAVVVGYDENGKELKEKVKPFSVLQLQRAVSEGVLVFSTTDQETISDLERFSYTKTPSGNIVYYVISSDSRGKRTGKDHFISAMLCFAYGLYITRNAFNTGRGTKRDIKSLFSARLV